MKSGWRLENIEDDLFGSTNIPGKLKRFDVYRQNFNPDGKIIVYVKNAEVKLNLESAIAGRIASGETYLSNIHVEIIP